MRPPVSRELTAENQQYSYSNQGQNSYSQNQQNPYGSRFLRTRTAKSVRSKILQYAPHIQQNYYQQNVYIDESGFFSENKMSRINGQSAYVKIGDWMKFDCLSFLSFIPILGWIVYLIFYFIIAFSSKTSKSLKTRLQANLIWSAISIGLFLVILIIGAVIGFSIGNAIQEFY